VSTAWRSTSDQFKFASVTVLRSLLRCSWHTVLTLLNPRTQARTGHWTSHRFRQERFGTILLRIDEDHSRSAVCSYPVEAVERGRL